MRFADAPPTADPFSGTHLKLPPPRARAAAARPRPTHLARSRVAPVAHLAHLTHLARLAHPRLLVAPVRRDAPGAPLAPETAGRALRTWRAGALVAPRGASCICIALGGLARLAPSAHLARLAHPAYLSVRRLVRLSY